jgi:hypothetical protein
MTKQCAWILAALLFLAPFAASAHAELADAHAEIGEGLLEKNGSAGVLACREANQDQIDEVNEGNEEKAAFLRKCADATDDSPWCAQLVRPNPSSISTFRCTYGEEQVHQLIHPGRDTWHYAYEAVELIQDLEAEGICVRQIYNWWRPEPYNGNVGGAAGRHPYGTSVDVRFCSMNDMERAHTRLCEYRAQGRLRALGYYGSTGLHFGIGDRTANTWGKSCPQD